MYNDVASIVLCFLLTALISYPLGRYIVKVFKNEKVWSDFLKPVEKFIFSVSGINAEQSMDWKEGLKSMLLINFLFFIWAYVLLLIKHMIFNPMNVPGMEPSLAFNTAASFVSNTNLQHYSGELSASYFTQIFVVMFLQFVSAGTGIAVLAMLFKGLSQKENKDLGNFYNLLVKSITRILMPISIIAAVILLVCGTPMTFSGAQKTYTLQGDTVLVSTGPIAAMAAIKELGTNGGGFFGVNSSHPFENPTYISSLFQNVLILLLPMALVFSFGFYLNKKRLGYYLFGVMAVIMIPLIIITARWEIKGNPEVIAYGISSQSPNMEGKEVRFGPLTSAYWAVTTTLTSNGSVNSMHDSFMPLSGAVMLINMMINAVFGGAGVGLLNFFVYLIVTVFIASLMTGRTPELLGKKIEAKEIKIAAIVLLLHPFLILTGTAIAAHISAINKLSGWTSNPGYHGFTEMLYEFTSAAANNGSGFEGLKDNNYFWNIMCGSVMILARYIPIIGPVAIAGFLGSKKTVPESAGTLRIDTLTFGILLIAVLVLLAALSFFPVLALGPLAEHFSRQNSMF